VDSPLKDLVFKAKELSVVGGLGGFSARIAFVALETYT
jgi:hypothetical protein